jgi:hypothetical protein
MPTTKRESFSFGGVDSRSNPANYPVDRALRCLNFAPTISGQLRLRQGYTAWMTNDTVGGTNNTIHSAVYYELFSASYLGPQYVMYGKNSQILSYNMSSQLSEAVGVMGSSNPWGHFRAENRIFISSGAAPPNTNYTASWENGDGVSWDGSTLRPIGLPGAAFLAAPSQNYAGAATNGTLSAAPSWSNPGNATGAPDGTYASVVLTSSELFSNFLEVTNFGFSIPTSASILGIQISVIGYYTGAAVSLQAYLTCLGAVLPGNGAILPLPAGSEATVAVGGPNNALGANLTTAIVNSSTFGVQLQALQSLGLGASSFVDSVRITLFYSVLNGASVSVTSSSIGSFSPTLLGGYQFYIAIYNPVTQHMGNRLAIGAPVPVSATTSAIVIAGLPLLSGYDYEWEYAVGMTQDGAQIPYWLTDAQGNNIIIGNTATFGTITIGNINLTQELPINNYPPPPLDKFARVGTRIFAGLAGNPYLSYSNDAADISNAGYVGIPEESWPPDQVEPMPDGQLPTSIHAYRLEGWFFSRENLCIWSYFLLQQGVNPWRGPYPGGCPSQRGFIETPHGPFWISTQKELCTFQEDGVVPVSDEYELALLGTLADATINTVELGYLLDQTQLIDQIVIKGLDAQGNPVIVIHDFLLKEERSPHGQGYNAIYQGLLPRTFVGAGFTPRQNVYDTGGRMRLWCGGAGAPPGSSGGGFFAQLEDGLSDNGAAFMGDYIGLIALGPNRPSAVELEYQGDPNIEWSYLPDYSLTLNEFIPVTQDVIPDGFAQTPTRFGVKFANEECRWLYIRAQLTSHPADGSFALTNPPFLPMPWYGCINLSDFKTGRERPEAR